MNIKHNSTLGKFKKYLNLKGYSKNSVKIYLHYVKYFINSGDLEDDLIMWTDTKLKEMGILVGNFSSN